MGAESGKWSLDPLDFEIWHFTIKCLAKKVVFLISKILFPLEKSFWLIPEKPSILPPWKNPSYAHVLVIGIK